MGEMLQLNRANNLLQSEVSRLNTSLHLSRQTVERHTTHIEGLEIELQARERPGEQADPHSVFSSEVLFTRGRNEIGQQPADLSFLRANSSGSSSQFGNKIFSYPVNIRADLFNSLLNSSEKGDSSPGYVPEQSPEDSTRNTGDSARRHTSVCEKGSQADLLSCLKCPEHLQRCETLTKEILAKNDRIKNLTREHNKLASTVEVRDKEIQELYTKITKLKDIQERRLNNTTNPFEVEEEHDTLLLPPGTIQ